MFSYNNKANLRISSEGIVSRIVLLLTNGVREMWDRGDVKSRERQPGSFHARGVDIG